MPHRAEQPFMVKYKRNWRGRKKFTHPGLKDSLAWGTRDEEKSDSMHEDYHARKGSIWELNWVQMGIRTRETQCTHYLCSCPWLWFFSERKGVLSSHSHSATLCHLLSLKTNKYTHVSSYLLRLPFWTCQKKKNNVMAPSFNSWVFSVHVIGSKSTTDRSKCMYTRRNLPQRIDTKHS